VRAENPGGAHWQGKRKRRKRGELDRIGRQNGVYETEGETALCGKNLGKRLTVEVKQHMCAMSSAPATHRP
jgi:hypothetical protein